MLHIRNLEEGVELFKVLGSDIRVNIILLLLKEKEMNMNEIAARLQITNGALTSHIRKLEEAGLIRVTQDSVGHGNQKVCSVLETRILVEIGTQEETGEGGIFRAEIPVGQYSDYQVFPTCGISTTKKMIGEVDDPRYFAHPDRTEAGILWLSKGYVEYLVPNILPAGQKIDELTFTMEISSEAPGFNNDWPSDITFLLNDTPVGVWTSPGDFGDRHGLFTPNWWFSGWNPGNPTGLSLVLTSRTIMCWVSGWKRSIPVKSCPCMIGCCAFASASRRRIEFSCPARKRALLSAINWLHSGSGIFCSFSMAFSMITLVNRSFITGTVSFMPPMVSALVGAAY